MTFDEFIKGRLLHMANDVAEILLTTDEEGVEKLNRSRAENTR